MNHVPDEALAAIDAFGEGLLRADPPPVRERLRSDLRLRIDAPSGDERTARCSFEIDHATPRETLREHGSFVATVADGVDDRLAAWGIRPPDAYEHVDAADDVQRYQGELTLP